jgi:aldehyde dehydrogenase (NAD+)
MQRTNRRSGQTRRCRRLWIVGDADICAKAEADSIGNLKRVWTSGGVRSTGLRRRPAGDSWLRRAIEVKNVWTPYGD